ncbi:hypothetical protein [Schaalia sp. lx-100]|uniref:hypothetical protein n=1 Tax=Schaalia sp. lx-100 TaxID=2899081 RepID=UPI001E57142C|nr:hypothetical protein [Schaalia sp. lx-100]MCD4558223.1 hypothetical protein [Schaalia sp. lx-100]
MDWWLIITNWHLAVADLAQTYNVHEWAGAGLTWPYVRTLVLDATALPGTRLHALTHPH